MASKIARKLRDDHLAPCIKRCENSSKIKGFSEGERKKSISFQDRLVVTASIFLHIKGAVYRTFYMQSYTEEARETRFTNPLRIPHEDATSSLESGK